MVNKNYVRGRAFEYRVKKHLEDMGYYVVRSAGSKSSFDLIAIPTLDNITLLPEVVLVQCKYGSKISKKERDMLTKLEHTFGCDSAIVIAWARPNKPIEFLDSKNKKVEWI